MCVCVNIYVYIIYLLKKNCILVNTIASNSAACERRPFCRLLSTCS